NTEEFRADVKALYKIKDINLARKVKDEIFNKYEKDKRYEASLKILDEGFKDSICHLSIRNSHSRLKTTNCLERLNQEVRRGEKVIRIFSNEYSAIPLISSPSAFGDQSTLISMRTS
ncbi:MAG: transposase, partial [Anaerococcus sp.]|nr:transposase [Anaerococcus sp.]